MALNTGSRGSEESSEKESAYKVYDVSQIVDKSKTRVLT